VLVDRALMAYRWLQLLRPFSTADGPRFPAVMRIFFVSTFVGTFLPASVGGDAVRAYALSREGVPGPASLASVLMDRVLGVLSILLAALFGLFLMRQLASNAFIQASLLVTALACAAAAVLVFSERARALTTKLLALVPSARLQHLVARLLDAFGQYASRRADLLSVLGGSLAVQVLRILQAWLLGVSLGIPDSPTLYFALIPIILLVMLLPITVNGIGTSQMGFVWFFGQAGVAYAPAFALSVLFVALGIVGNLPGSVLYLSGGLHGPERRS
jgi:glycosyltransferase 2 family protein